MKYTKSTIIVIAILAISYLVFLSIENKTGHRIPDDNIRTGHVRFLQIALDHYANDHENLFPPVPHTCTSVTVLNDYLVPQYLKQIPRVAHDSQSDTPYQIAVSLDRGTYLIQAVLDDSNNHLLQKDIDGIVMGCKCDDPNYCVVPP